MPKVSAITSIYKSEKYLEGYIKNVGKQKFKDFEVHIDLNKPSEFERSKLSNFSKNNEKVKLNISESLKSMSASWNTCILNSNSEYICLWNVDDQRSKNSLKVMSDALDTNKDIDIVLHGHTHRYRNEFKDKVLYFNPGESAGMLEGKNSIGIVNLNDLSTKRIFF